MDRELPARLLGVTQKSDLESRGPILALNHWDRELPARKLGVTQKSDLESRGPIGGAYGTARYQLATCESKKMRTGSPRSERTKYSAVQREEQT